MIREYLISQGRKESTAIPIARQRAATPENAKQAVRRRRNLARAPLLVRPASDCTRTEIFIADESEAAWDSKGDNGHA